MSQEEIEFLLLSLPRSEALKHIFAPSKYSSSVVALITLAAAQDIDVSSAQIHNAMLAGSSHGVEVSRLMWLFCRFRYLAYDILPMRWHQYASLPPNKGCWNGLNPASPSAHPQANSHITAALEYCAHGRNEAAALHFHCALEVLRRGPHSSELKQSSFLSDTLDAWCSIQYEQYFVYVAATERASQTPNMSAQHPYAGELPPDVSITTF